MFYLNQCGEMWRSWYYLKQNNFLHNILLNIDIIPVYLLCSEEIPVVWEVDIQEETEFEKDENLLDHNIDRVSANESFLIPTVPSEKSITMAPGEGVIPISILAYIHCEELAQPHLFSTGKFYYKFQRKVELSPVKYFKVILQYEISIFSKS